MVDNKLDTVLEIGENLADTLTDFVIPISDGLKPIDETAITDDIVDQWKTVQEMVYTAIEETEMAIYIDQELLNDVDDDENEE